MPGQWKVSTTLIRRRKVFGYLECKQMFIFVFVRCCSLVCLTEGVNSTYFILRVFLSVFIRRLSNEKSLACMFECYEVEKYKQSEHAKYCRRLGLPTVFRNTQNKYNIRRSSTTIVARQYAD